MGEKALWPTVAIIGMVCTAICVMMIAGVPVVEIIAAFSIAGNLIGLMLYGKLQKVESNTNGAMTEQQSLIRELVDTVRKSPPVELSEKE